MNAVTAGTSGPRVRSDCLVTITETGEEGRNLKIQSKVMSMYGDSIHSLVNDMLDTFNLTGVLLEIDDQGALPYTMAARIETAIKRFNPSKTGVYLPDTNPAAQREPVRERLRRSRLYLPGNDPKFAINAGLHDPDGVILDLEDSVAPTEKDAARILVRNTLRCVDFYGSETMVRINQLPLGLEDLEAVIPEGVHVILIPKCESAEQVVAVEERINDIRIRCGREAPVFLMPIIESAAGAFKALEIATASPSLVGLTIGLEDYTADIGTQRTAEGRESFWARCQVVNAARAAGIQPIDTVFSDVSDEEGLRLSVLEAKSLGFEGKGLIHPRQIRPTHDTFAPTQEEYARAKRIVDAFEDAKARGLGVVSLGSKMIDAPVVKRAQYTLRMAKAAGMEMGGVEE